MTATTKTRNALRASLKSEDASIEKRLPAADAAAAPSSAAAAGAGAASEAVAPTGRATKAPTSTHSRSSSMTKKS